MRNEFEIMPVPHFGASFGWLYCRKMLKRLFELVFENCLYLAEMCGVFVVVFCLQLLATGYLNITFVNACTHLNYVNRGNGRMMGPFTDGTDTAWTV